MFGSSLTCLVLDIRYGISGMLQCHSVTSPLISPHIPGSIIEAIQSLRQLQDLEVWCGFLPDPPVVSTESQTWRIQNLLSVLHAVHTQAQLMQLTIEFNLNAPWKASRAPGTYCMDRDSFLNDILNCNEVKDALRQFPALQDISLRLWENDTLRYGEEWWRSEIESRLQPDLRAAISVDLNSKIWISTWSSSVLR